MDGYYALDGLRFQTHVSQVHPVLQERQEFLDFGRNILKKAFDKEDLLEFTVLTESPMPSYGDSLNSQELADVLAYLVSLKG